MSNEGLRARAQKFMLERDSTTIHWTRNNVAQELADFAQQIREECAQIADRLASNQTNVLHPAQRMTVETTAESIAAEIRNLAEKEPT
jgi:hypothetical protein